MINSILKSIEFITLNTASAIYIGVYGNGLLLGHFNSIEAIITALVGASIAFFNIVRAVKLIKDWKKKK